MVLDNSGTKQFKNNFCHSLACIKSAEQLMGAFSLNLLLSFRFFLKTGIDYFGSFYSKQSHVNLFEVTSECVFRSV